VKTLWLRADDIPVQQPIHHVIFHALFLLFAYGGFRQGMVIGKVKFRDIQMAIIRDPVDATRRQLVTTIEINRNKLKQDALEHKKGEKLVPPSFPLFHLGRQTNIINRYSFSTTLLHYPLLCLTRLIAVLGIHFKAFEDDVTSVDDLLNRPILENFDYIPIKWKESMLDKLILPMSWPVFIRIFRRCLLVDGCPFLPCLYAMRMGAGADLDSKS
jgi:hypothetical protein